MNTRREVIEATEWANKFKIFCRSQYEDAITYACQLDMLDVVVRKTDETGKWLWAIEVSGTDFWLDAFPTKKEAVALCRKMGWRVVKP